MRAARHGAILGGSSSPQGVTPDNALVIGFRARARKGSGCLWPATVTVVHRPGWLARLPRSAPHVASGQAGCT